MEPKVELLVQTLHRVIKRWVEELVLHALGPGGPEWLTTHLDIVGQTGRVWPELRREVPEEVLTAFEREINAVLMDLRYVGEEFLRLNARPPSETGRAWLRVRLRLDQYPDWVTRLPIWRRSVSGPTSRA